MKRIFQPIVSAVALAVLLGGAASQATPLAELPLKADVLAKPNVVFGIDDSGSMDWELLLKTASGIMWSNNTLFPGWDTGTGKPRFSGSSSDNFSYLFPVGWIPGANPVGDAPGGNIYGSNETYFRVVPPTPQFAWLRSAAFNPQFYDPSITYKPWAPAYFGSSLQNFGNSPPAAAKIHPTAPGAPTFNLTQEWNATNAGSKWANSGGGYRFRLLPGMKAPVGSRLPASSTTTGACSGSTETDISAELTVNSGSCFASIPYFPATYWHAEACTVDGIKCAAAPDGSTLRRYEIKGTGVSRAQGDTTPFPSGRSYADELQNFANWFTYYRKRKLSLAGSMGGVLEDLTGVHMGSMLFSDAAKSSPPSIVMYDADAAAPASNRLRTLGDFYRLTPDSAGTPTHKTMQVIGDQFNTNTGIVQYACQRNAMFVVTDGFANKPSGNTVPTVPSYSKTTFGAAAPYANTSNDSLADLGLAYYTKRLRASGGSMLPAGKVPPSTSTAPNADKNPDLHVNTYAISLGVEGYIWPALTDPFASPPSWPTPAYDSPDMLDDLWHATINGRGRMYLAKDAETTKTSIQSAFSDFLNQNGAQGSIAVSAVNLDRGDSQAYLASYNPAGWTGDIAANPIDKTTGLVDMTPANQIWSASKLLNARTWSTRAIFSSSGSSGVDFDDANVGAAVLPSGATFTSAQLVDSLRGSSAGEGTLFRDRSRTITVNGTPQTLHHLIGPVINAEPVLARDEKMVYMASGDGMLHAFDTVTGKEEWAYVPPEMLAGMGKSAARGWVFRTLLDATPVYGKLSGGAKMLIGGLGAAGRSYYALDVSNPKNLSAASAAAQFRWTFPKASDTANRALMGYTVGKPVIVKTAATTDRILVTSGYDNGQAIGDGKGRLWVLDTSGNVINSFVTGAGAMSPGQEAGLAHVSAFKEPDGTVRFVYGGDLLGNLWRFDLVQTAGTTEIAADLVAVFKDGTGTGAKLQPITAAPELATVGGKRIILVGTGRILDIGDFGSADTQSFYAVADGVTLNNARSGLVRQVYTRGGTPELTANAVNWSSDRGWYFDLPAGEQANTDPIVTYGAVSFVTNKNGKSDCSQQSYLYLVDIGTGTRVKGSTFVADLISASATSSRMITLRVVNGEIVGTAHKSDNTVYTKKLPLGEKIDPSKNAWKEIRR